MILKDTPKKREDPTPSSDPRFAAGGVRFECEFSQNPRERRKRNSRLFERERESEEEKQMRRESFNLSFFIFGVLKHPYMPILHDTSHKY